MIVTTFDGLYRYRTEDRVCIRGFLGTTPVYEFVGRTGDILCALNLKIPEFLIRGSVCAVMKRKNLCMKEMVCTEAINLQLLDDDHLVERDSKNFVVFLELESGDKIDQAIEQEVDEELQSRVYFYAKGRGSKGRLQPIRIFHVKPRALLLVKETFLSTNPNASSNQYKVPKVTRRLDFLKCFMNNLIE